MRSYVTFLPARVIVTPLCLASLFRGNWRKLFKFK